MSRTSPHTHSIRYRPANCRIRLRVDGSIRSRRQFRVPKSDARQWLRPIFSRMPYQALKQEVLNRGIPPDTVLDKLISWGKSAPDEIFAPNQSHDIYSAVAAVLGPWNGPKHRRAAMLEVMRVLAGFESSWDWNTGTLDVIPTPLIQKTPKRGKPEHGRSAPIPWISIGNFEPSS